MNDKLTCAGGKGVQRPKPFASLCSVRGNAFLKMADHTARKRRKVIRNPFYLNPGFYKILNFEV